MFAIAITLLVLDLPVPRTMPEDARLLDTLLAQWPAYFAFVTSFATIGITFVPFPTALIAEFIKHRDSSVAALVLGGTYTLVAVFFNAIWWYASYRRRLLRRTVSQATIRSINRSYALGTPLYLISMLLALISAPASLGMNLLLAVFYALPSRLLPRLFR